MKIAPLLTASLLFQGAMIVVAPADPPQEPDTWMYDPDGAPRAFIEGYEKKDTIQNDARQTEVKQTAADEVMLRDYEERERANAAAEDRHASESLYNQMLASDPNLEKSNDASSSSTTLQPSAGGQVRKASLSLRTDVPPVKVDPTKSFITSFNSAPTMELSHFFTSEPGSHTGSSHPEPKTPPPADPLAKNLPDVLDTPGMTAAEKDPTAKDLSLDLLPGETGQDEHAHHDLSLELPTVANVDRLQKQTAASLLVPGQKPKTAPPVPINPILLKAPNDQENMVPVPPPMRMRVEDPYDIINR